MKKFLDIISGTNFVIKLIKFVKCPIGWFNHIILFAEEKKLIKANTIEKFFEYLVEWESDFFHTLIYQFFCLA